MVRAQTGIAFLVLIVVLVAVSLYLYQGGYLSGLFPATHVPHQNSYVPLTVNVTSPHDLSSLYPNQQFQVISTISNSRNTPMTATIVPFGCSFLPTTQRTVTIPQNSPSSIQWTFSSSSATSCAITFKVCFNDTAYTDYPVTFVNYQFTGTPPTSPPTSSSGVPISIYLQGLNSTITAPPSTVNSTVYVNSLQLSSFGIATGLKWVNIKIENDQGYFTLYSNQISRTSSINLSANRYELAFQNGNLLSPFPFLLAIPPVTNPQGYTSNVAINVSTAYTYCVSSNSLPVGIK